MARWPSWRRQAASDIAWHPFAPACLCGSLPQRARPKSGGLSRARCSIFNSPLLTSGHSLIHPRPPPPSFFRQRPSNLLGLEQSPQHSSPGSTHRRDPPSTPNLPSIRQKARASLQQVAKSFVDDFCLLHQPRWPATQAPGTLSTIPGYIVGRLAPLDRPTRDLFTCAARRYLPP